MTRRSTEHTGNRGAVDAYAARMLTLAHAVEAQSRIRPDAIALVSAATGARITYAELAERAARLATWLAEEHGVVHGDRVAVLAHNDVRTFELLVACSRLGAALAPLNVRLSDDELEAVLGQCEPRVLFVDDAHAARAPKSAAVRRPLLALVLASGSPRAIAGAIDDTVVLLFTSGTTGKPKGAMLTHRSIAANADSTRRAWELSERDVALVDAPLFHTGGLNVLATPLLYAGGTVVVAPRFDAVLSGEILVREGCTVAFGVPTMIERLLASGVVDRSRVRLYVTGGAPCPRTLLDAFAEKGVALVQGFGMTECGPNCFRPMREAGRTGSVGTPTFGLETRLVGDDGKDVAEGEPGELLLRGPHVFGGYFRDEPATRAALDAEGWLHTGDVLRATSEGWFVAGRKKEMFISGGENVYPAEVEMAFTQHAAVAEAAVVSITDPKWGEAGVAYVLARAGAPEPTAEALRAFLRERIAAYKVPRTIYVAHELPRTASGKIDKRELTTRAAAPAA
ncbi:MAG: AMP-dependent synthetase and ligase [Labilithrix sp.]|nr:AMP-dependent synthetase and ligase [Labilithrix sp.]